MRRCAFRWLCATVFAALLTTSQVAQAQDVATRAEEIELARRQKHATLWPEREGLLVGPANRLLERGLLEGIRNGLGNNGWQLLFTGTRSAQGQTFGIGYRRSDLFHDALNVRATVRGSLAGALLVDGEVEINNLGDRPTHSSPSIRSTSGRRRWSSTALAAIREWKTGPATCWKPSPRN